MASDPSTPEAEQPEPTDAGAEASAASSETASVEAPPKGFQFSDHGCRTEIRLGVLLILVAVFLWLWLGPRWCSLLYLIGLPMVLVGVPIQAWQTRVAGRPGYPLTLGLVLTVAAVLMWPDMRYREIYDGPASVQPMAPMLLSAGVWMLLWWPLTRFKAPAATTHGEATA